MGGLEWESHTDCMLSATDCFRHQELLWDSTVKHEADALATAPSILLVLPFGHIDRFVQLAPGFKAMCHSIASSGGGASSAGAVGLGTRVGRRAADVILSTSRPESASSRNSTSASPTAQSVRGGVSAPVTAPQGLRDDGMDDETMMVREWAQQRMVLGRACTCSPWRVFLLPQVREWAQQRMVLGALGLVREEPPENRASPTEEERWRAQDEAKRHHAYMLAHQKHDGDSRTLAAKASGRPWRTNWSFAHQLRAEQLVEIDYRRPREQQRQHEGQVTGVEEGSEGAAEPDASDMVEQVRRFNSMREPTPPTPWIPPHVVTMPRAEREALVQLPPRDRRLSQEPTVAALAHARSDPRLIAHRDTASRITR